MHLLRHRMLNAYEKVERFMKKRRLFASLLVLAPMLLLLLLADTRHQRQPVTWLTPGSPDDLLNRSAIASTTRQELSWKHLVGTNGTNRTRFSRLVIYNRVDKCGSSTLRVLIRRLCFISGTFEKFSSKVYWKRYLSNQSQAKLVKFLTKKSKKFPLVYDRHISYIDFSRMKKSSPIYINLVRDPVDRFISLFHFLRSSRHTRNRSLKDSDWLEKNLTECVLDGDPECALSQEYRHSRSRGQAAEFFQPMTAFFCGHEPMCREFNSRQALQRALQNLEQKYAVVGVLESFRQSLEVLEFFVPRYFRNIRRIYDKQRKKKVNQSSARPEVPEVVRSALASRLAADIELYQFAIQRLHLQFRRISPP